MTPSDTPMLDAKAFLFLAGTLVVALHEDVEATIRLTATFKDHTRQQARICCDNHQTAEAYFTALGVPEARAWWRCFHP